MRKIVMTLVAFMTMTMAFAGNSDAKSFHETDAYDMHVNIRRLGTTLGLTIDQMDAVKYVHKMFRTDMLDASKASADKKAEKVNEAVEKNLTYMSYVLDKKQMAKYTTLINTTLANRGLK